MLKCLDIYFSRYVYLDLFPSSYYINELSAVIIKLNKQEELCGKKRERSLDRREVHVGDFYYIKQSTVFQLIKVLILFLLFSKSIFTIDLILKI